jgi:hypothetical protein
MYRLILILLCAVFVFQGAQAQHTDSLFYGDTKTLLVNPYGWGFIAGTNAYGDIGKYQRFDYASFTDTYVVGAHVWFGFKSIIDYPDTVRIVVRDAAADGSPGDLLTFTTLRTSDLDTLGAGNIVYFPHPQQILGLGFVSDTIFVGVEWNEWDPAQSDTIGIISDPNGFGENLQRVWERIFYNEAWVMWSWINSPDPNFEWTVDSDLWIAALTNPSPASLAEDGLEVPLEFALSQNYPNPFNPSTTLEFTVPAKGMATLKVFTVIGEEVATLFAGEAESGQLYKARFNAAEFPSGMYIARLEFGGQQTIRKMLLAK